MTVDEIMLEIEILSDEELENLIDNINNFKKTRKEVKKNKAIEKLRKAWNEVISLDIDIYNGDDLISNFEDLEFYF